MNVHSLRHAVVDIDVDEAAPSVDECINDANVDFALDIAHHAEWLEDQKPGAMKEWAMETILQLAGMINSRHAVAAYVDSLPGELSTK